MQEPHSESLANYADLRRHYILRNSAKSQLRARMHAPPGETGKWLQTVVRGYFQYRGVPGNRRVLASFRWALARHWRRSLRRRGQKRRISWGRFYRLLDAHLPRPRCCHPFPSVRFAATHPR